MSKGLDKMFLLTKLEGPGGRPFFSLYILVEKKNTFKCHLHIYFE